MIIWLASYPRSGNKLFTNLIQQHLKVKAYSVYNNPKNIYNNFEDKNFKTIALQPDELNAAAKAKDVFFVKTHELPQTGDHNPTIYIVRDGRDAITSYSHHILNNVYKIAPTSATEKFIQQIMHTLINSSDQFGGWGAHVLSWTNRSDKTFVIRYENLIHPEKPLGILSSALKELGVDKKIKIIDWSPLPGFDYFHAMNPVLYRKGKTGSWLTEMSFEHHLSFWELHGEAMLKMGYKNDADQLALRIDFAIKEALGSKNTHSFAQLNQKINDELSTKEQVIQEIHQANQRLTDELIAKEQVIQDIYRANQRLTDELIAKEQVIQDIHQTNQKLINELTTKEQTVREFQRTFAYKFHKSISGFKKHSS